MHVVLALLHYLAALLGSDGWSLPPLHLHASAMHGLPSRCVQDARTGGPRIAADCPAPADGAQPRCRTPALPQRTVARAADARGAGPVTGRTGNAQ